MGLNQINFKRELIEILTKNDKTIIDVIGCTDGEHIISMDKLFVLLDERNQTKTDRWYPYGINSQLLIIGEDWNISIEEDYNSGQDYFCFNEKIDISALKELKRDELKQFGLTWR